MRNNILKQKIIRICNNKLSYNGETALFYCFPRYRKRIDEMIINYENNLKVINKKVRKKPIVIVFVCQVPALWNGMKSIYEAARDNKDIIEYVVAIPEKKTKADGRVSEEYEYNYAYDYCKSEIDKNLINGYDENENLFFDIKSLNPSYVFLPRPYDEHLPNAYMSSEINKFTKVCYIPYGYTICKWDSRTGYSMNFICNCYAIFAENDYYKTMLEDIFHRFNCSTKKIFQLGYPRFDLYKDLNKLPDANYKTTVLWMPRWTTDSAVEATTFFKYKDFLIKFFLEHKEVKLICRPHPLMLRNFVASNLLSEEEAETFLRLFKENDNFEYDNNGDYTTSLKRADIIISDFSSLVVEEMLMNVPILYTGNKKNFGHYTKRLAKSMYTVYNETDLKRQLLDLLNGKDPLREERIKVRDILFSNGFECGKRIVEKLIEEA